MKIDREVGTVLIRKHHVNIETKQEAHFRSFSLLTF